MSGRDESAATLAAGTDAPRDALLLMGVERAAETLQTAGGMAAGAGAIAAGGAEPPRKRAKLAPDERKRVLEYKLLRLKTLRDRFTDQLSELFFLQAGGNMMDFSAWRKRPPAPQLVAFLEARRPPPPAPPPPDPPPAAAAAAAAADEVVEKARQEAYVARRVAELARAGLWAERRLPRVLEPPRPKSHWDYLLEEMAWLAQDFAHERKWKKQAAKKCARAVQKYFQDKALAAQKAEKAQELQLRKIAAFAAKEIRLFWGNVEKLVEWKRVRRVERARKEALDEQLSYIVDRTERYSRQLAATLRPDGAGAGACAGAAASASDDEFQPRSGSPSDDEETIAAAERAAPASAADTRRELQALRRDSRRDLQALLPPGYRPPTAHSPPPSDYGPDADDSADDEGTIDEQERQERPEDTAAELDALRLEAELGIDELVRRYKTAPPLPPPLPTQPPLPAAPDDVDADADADAAGDTTDAGSDTDGSDAGDDSDDESGASTCSSQPLEALMEAGAGEVADSGAEEGGERRVEACASLAAALQPTGTTLADTAVGTPVPRLLKHALREYQHVGLHWLATMHARHLNGILADEMGLGKTIQTIALLAHLALERADWGPHLVVAPTSVVLNWEMEFKKWCPAFKILTYYGTIKERKLKRVGWTKANSFHVCITSYKLVVQDHQSFRRKRWKYLILDEAQNIKNFKSQRWQMLLNFQTERRLLLTGTPLQNSLLELWSLMHFLMPAVFASHSHFREWFGDVAAAAEGAARNDALVRRLHEVLRPFLLRRLKADVERQMPRKYEHVLLCRLSKRQRFLYDDFMARAKTKETLASGNLLSVINVLMQLRKVCNHPDLFEPRPVVSPLHLPALRLRLPALVLGLASRASCAARLAGDLASLEVSGAEAFPAHRARHLAPPRRLVEELCERRAPPPPRPPPARLRLHLRLVPRAPPSAAAAAPPAPPLRPAAPRPAPASRAPPATAPAPAPPPPAPAPVPAPPAARLEARRRACLRRLAAVNERRCWRLPLYGADLRAAVAAAAPLVPPRDIADVLIEMHDIIDQFSVCWSAARASALRVEVSGGSGARAWARAARAARRVLCAPARAALKLLHAPAARQAVAFPHPRLLQYDCGKLQTLAQLLRRLKAGGHRVLIFTQMTRVLDVLEGFLSLHGHAYLRLDGATRVDARQPLVDRFNADARVFAMILSTRSGGVGLNLTGADAVVFYDSDWNPTMDAQAQDRAHRIGQTRDVHVYRLVTAATVEENILRKADQKRALGHMAIEDGHFTTSYLRQANIKELFGGESGADSGASASPCPGGAESSGSGSGSGGGGELETALAACEDEADAAAARAARIEQRTDLAEFDETLPLDEDAPPAPPPAPAPDPDPDPALTDELSSLMKQLTPIEKYAMRIVESGETATALERAALDDMRRQLQDWGDKRRRLRDASPPAPSAAPRAPSPAADLTYSREDARATVWVCDIAPNEQMPMWCPPTPPSGDGDVYCDAWARALYRAGAAPDAALPPVHRRDLRAREPRRRAPVRAAPAPASLFERAGAGARPRARARLTPAAAAAAARDAPHAPDWAPCEDAALRRALRLQRLPADPPAALAPNWEWVAELVNEAARAFRSQRAARDRHDALADPERARRKHKKPPAARRRPDDDAPRPPLARLDAMRDAAERRRAQPKRRLDDAAHHNPKHAALLADHGVDYEAPPTPMEVATRRAERIAKEKQKAGAAASAPPGPGPAAAPPAAAAPPQRIVVAAAPAPAPNDPARRARAAAPPPTGAGVAPALYRQQAAALQARHHLKILHHAPHPHAAGGAGGSGGGEAAAAAAAAAAASGAAAGAGAALRTLQLQQLALRRARGPAPHVVVAHLAPHPAPAPAPAPSPAPTHAPPHAPRDKHHDDNTQQ